MPDPFLAISLFCSGLLAGIVKPFEGGYVDHPADPGGATNLGITIHTLRAWRGAAVTKQDVKNLTVAEAIVA